MHLVFAFACMYCDGSWEEQIKLVNKMSYVRPMMDNVVVERVVEFLTAEKFSVYRNIVSVLGAAYVLKVFISTFWSLSGGFCAYFLAPWGISRINLRKYGSWAIVTGASEGIGRAYAIELAKQGLNVSIMSRSEEKLQKVADEIRERYGREVRVLSVDFTQGQSVYDDIQAEISDLDVAVLVNNVGLYNTGGDLTADVDEMLHRRMIEVNCQAMVQMTHLVLPKMVEKKAGVIVNISSMGALSPNPLINVYSASKIFADYFSTGLQYEYKNKGIIVQCVYPGLVTTAATAFEKPSLMAPSPEKYVKSAVATIGIQNNTFGYLPHALQAWIMSFIPKSVLIKAAASFLSAQKKLLASQKRD